MTNIIALLMAIGLCILWLTAGLLLLPLAVLGWVVKTMQRGLGWLINLGGA
ncbi:exported hypothetical protein [Cupriavidus taiwanensis]|uniref:hypothetical protein n=1 Tax=Cupriavidus taiwanensis TaxID=164546 RepID=UPI000E194B58|nr:hypothetical protein [Cupriavidus taiwanensis]SOY79950.1 exported hypothetical protein [Cupriavidus taiwanensis]SOY81920.1 exported hypothetical protein [Cupriavidus taiwanensis]